MVALPVDTSPALAELQNKQQWVVWCYEYREGKQTKVPYKIDGYRASTTNEKDWSTYLQAMNACKNRKNRDGKQFDGVGFVFNNDTIGIDLDHCIDEHGKVDAWAKKIIDHIGSYAERSPSRTGIHILVLGSLQGRKGTRRPMQGKRTKDAAIEMYSAGRFFTITGDHLEGTPKTLEDKQTLAIALHDKITAPKPAPKKSISKAASAALSLLDNDLLDIAFKARNGAKFAALWRGDTADYQGDESRADAAFCQMLAFYTGKDEQRIDSFFRRSGLYREKWDSSRGASTYGQITIAHALEQCTEVYVPGNGNNQHDTNNVSDNNGSSGNGNIPPSNGFNLCEFSADDAGNGDALQALYGDDFLWCSARGWFSYTGTHWELDDDGSTVKKRAVETLRKRRHAAVDAEKEAIVACTKADERRVNGCVSRFKTLVTVSIEDFDCNPDLLNCQNGVVNLRTGRLEPHTREQRFTYCLPVPYAEADALEWLDYLQGVVGGGQEVIDYLQMALGYSMTGHTREEVLFYLYGPSRSGKGTFAETIQRLMPKPLSAMVDFNSFTAKREGDVSNFDLAPLKPARLIFASESNRSQSLNPSKIKQLTGGDYIRACFKHKDFFEYRPQFKIWMMSNWPVNGDPEDDALWGRVRVIEFPNSFLGKEDKGKKDRLGDPEILQGVLYWLVQGAMKWYALGSAGLPTPASVASTTNAQRDELDYVQQWLDECCDDDEEGWISNEEVMKSYSAWCDENNVQHKKGPKGLAQSLKAKGYEPGIVKEVAKKSKRGVRGLYIH